MDTEVNAYIAEAVFQKAANCAESVNDGWTPVGGYDMENIYHQAEDSVEAACGKSTTGSCGQ